MRSLSVEFRSKIAIIACVGWLAGAPFAAAQDSGPADDLERAFERCQAIQDDAARLYCYKNAAGGAPSQQSPQALGTWHFVRTPNPTGGNPAISVTQSADITRSDPDFGGLMLRCGAGAPEVLVVLVRYLALGAHPKVTVGAAQTSTEFSGSVVAPGLLVLLPQEATALATGPWQTMPELSVRIDDSGSVLQGVVPLTGLKGALEALRSNCPAQ
jgi:hypothetical protein